MTRTGTLQWFKSSHSDGGGGNCVEVALHPRTIHIRDSKNPGLPHLSVGSPAWSDFLTWTG